MPRPPDPARREELLGAAASFLQRDGRVDAPLDEIAEAAGTSRRMLLYHFGTKDELVAAALDRCAAEGRDLLGALGTDPGIGLHETVTGFWRWLTVDEGRSMRLFFSAVAAATAGNEAAARYVEATTAAWVELGERIAGRGGADERRATAVATAAVATLRGLMLDRLTTGDLARTDAAAALVARVLADALEG